MTVIQVMKDFMLQVCVTTHQNGPDPQTWLEFEYFLR